MRLSSPFGKCPTETHVKSILALVDFSGLTDQVVKTAADIASASKAKLFFLHVASPEADYEGRKMRTNVSREGVANEMVGYLHAMQKIESDSRAAGIDATAILVRGTSVRGNPAPKILKEIIRVKPDLIVVGSHGHSRVYEALLGSVSSAVVHKAPCPVVIVPAGKLVPRSKPRTSK
jgi:nucleotide-binding universal stress UspA family protein